MSWSPIIRRRIGWTSGHALLLAALASVLAAGCIDGPPDDGTQEGSDPKTQATNETTVPGPVVINGTAVVGNPVHAFACIESGVDGEYHKIGRDVDDWRYRLDPVGHAVYWFDAEEEYLEGGAQEGTVPKGAAFAEVCKTDGAETTVYTLTIVHPDHGDA